MWLSLYHPDYDIDDEDRGNPTKWQTLEDAAVGVRAVASLSCAVFIPKTLQEPQNI